MGYVIVAIVVVLIVAAGVAFFARGAAARRDDPRSIAAPDSETPLGDTAHHAEPDGTGERSRDNGAHAAPPVDGGEGEGRRSVPPPPAR
jgi:hypothetical protein